ncbi:MAG: PAS domain-containing protein [Firmicutes bacterium]|nr:PAS domain-containing protein [Bacillota bacterium]
MTKKILTGVITVSLIIMLVCVGLVMGIMYDYMGEKIDEQLKNEAILIEEALGCSGTSYMDSLAERSEIGNRVTLISADGVVVYDTMADETAMENHTEREEVQEALINGEGYAVRTSFTLEEDTRYYARKTADNLIVRTSVNHYSQLALLLDTFGMVILTVVVLIIISLVISYRIAKAIIKPINDIDLDNPDISENYEELAPLLHRIQQQNIRIRRQMENLRKNREEFNIITENMSEGLLIIDRDMEVLTYNRSALEMLRGTGETDFSGSVLGLNRSEPFRKAVADALEGKGCQVLMESSGSTYEIISNPVREKGIVSGAVLIILDVTERAMGERMRREFTSNVSHELKTPLTSIYGVSDMIAGGMVKPEDVQGFAKTIREESSRLISLINDIINLSQLDENTVPQEKTRVDVSAVAENVVARLSGKAAGSDVTVSFSGEPSEITAVEYILDEIVYNIVENAIKYNKPGGTVDVSVRNIGTNCIFTVKDTGIGIPESAQPRVFERFYRVDKSHSKQIGGTGLGLSIVKHAVGYLDGEISLESEEGKGTTVTVIFSK